MWESAKEGKYTGEGTLTSYDLVFEFEGYRMTFTHAMEIVAEE